LETTVMPDRNKSHPRTLRFGNVGVVGTDPGLPVTSGGPTPVRRGSQFARLGSEFGSAAGKPVAHRRSRKMKKASTGDWDASYV
jgi:hypothetical protein